MYSRQTVKQMWKYFSDISFDISPETLEDSYVVKNDRWQRVAIVHFLQNFHSSSGIPSKKISHPINCKSQL